MAWHSAVSTPSVWGLAGLLRATAGTRVPASPAHRTSPSVAATAGQLCEKLFGFARLRKYEMPNYTGIFPPQGLPGPKAAGANRQDSDQGWSRVQGWVRWSAPETVPLSRQRSP